MNYKNLKKQWSVALMGMTLLSMLPACSLSNDSERKEAKEEMEEALKDEDQDSDTLQNVNVAVESDSASPDEVATPAGDSLAQIDEMVAAVEETAAPSSDWKATYNAKFFTNSANKASKPSAKKYVETSSGLRYAVINSGSGSNPISTSNVTVHYTGMLPDGTVFDSSLDRGEPTTFPLNRVIPGWTEGLQYMKPGATAVFYIPSNLGYGPQGIPGTIPPNSPLIFWVQLLKVN